MSEITPYDFMELEPKSEFCMRGPTNSHAQNTKRKDFPNNKPNLTALIDWFSCTFDNDHYDIQFVINLLFKYLDLPLDININRLDIGHNTIWEQNKILEKGYPSSLSYGHIAIMYGAKKRGIKLSLSGQGCRDFELLMKPEFDWLDFLREVQSLNTNITRIDLAIDDYKGYFKVADLIDICRKKHLRSKFKDWASPTKYDIATGESKGETLELGTRKSRIFCRIYEKNKEQGLSNDFIWNRVELQIMNENADIAVSVIKDGEKHIAEYALGMLKNYVIFCDPFRKVNKDGTEERRIEPDKNKSRWLPTKEWESFLLNADKIKLTTEKPKSNIDTKRRWIDDKIAKTIAMSVLAEIDDDREMLWLKNVIYQGMLKFDDKDQKMIRKHREDKKRTAYQNSKQSEPIIIDVDI